MKNSYDIYKKMIIKWNQGGLSYRHYYEKMIITPNQVSFVRKVNCYMDVEEDFDCQKWTIKTNDVHFGHHFYDICSTFINHSDEVRVNGCDTDMFSIEVVLDDNSRIKENFECDFKSNNLSKLAKLLNNIIPNSFSKPYFLK